MNKFPLYCEQGIPGAKRVIIVGDVHQAATLNTLTPFMAGEPTIATAPAAGSTAGNTDWSVLAGKDLVFWPNNDYPDVNGIRMGIVRMRGAVKAVQAIDPPAATLFWFDPDTAKLPYGVNIEEICYGNTDLEIKVVASLVDDLLESAVPLGASVEINKLFTEIAAGKRRTLEWPWTKLLQASKASVPGTVTLVCGDPGASKSLWMLELFLFWHQQGHKVAIFEIEDDRPYHMRRVLAMLANDSKVTDNDWAEQFAADAAAISRKYEAVLDALGECVYVSEDRPVSLPELADWVEKQASLGCAAILIDPVTLAKVSSKPWIDDAEFIVRVKASARRHKTRLFLVTHPRKGPGSAGKELVGMDGLAGGAVYARATHTILWLDRPEEPKEVHVLAHDSSSVTHAVEANREVRILKARNGPGAGARIAMHFDRNSLRIQELGIIVRNN